MSNSTKLITSSWAVCNIAAVVSFIAGGVAVISTLAKVATTPKG